ncbi:MAG TPA: hypothetical protein VFU66_13165, partial [Edaphobacter sp.]|nr:hypothetical protein [Edaphobacter sp.]
AHSFILPLWGGRDYAGAKSFLARTRRSLRRRKTILSWRRLGEYGRVSGGAWLQSLWADGGVSADEWADFTGEQSTDWTT